LGQHLGQQSPPTVSRRCRPVIRDSELANYPMLSLVGTADADRRSWWVMNEPGLVETLRCAGFATVEIVSRFRLKHRHTALTVDHLLAHALP
jgi:hypothetical protein